MPWIFHFIPTRACISETPNWLLNSAWWPDGWGKWWRHSKCQGNSTHPRNQATLNHLTHCAPVQHRPSDRSAPLHHQFLSSISPFPHVEIRASCIIIVGFTVCGIHGGGWPAILPTSTLADASSSSTNSAADTAAHHHNHPSVYRLGLCCPGIEGPAKLNPAQWLLL